MDVFEQIKHWLNPAKSPEPERPTPERPTPESPGKPLVLTYSRGNPECLDRQPRSAALCPDCGRPALEDCDREQEVIELFCPNCGCLRRRQLLLTADQLPPRWLKR